VRATGLRAMRQRHQLTQRTLARELGVMQNYISALEGGTRRPGPRLRSQLLQRFGCDFEELFEVVMVDPATHQERRLRLDPSPDRGGG